LYLRGARGDGGCCALADVDKEEEEIVSGKADSIGAMA
jgi:hypothetical protein